MSESNRIIRKFERFLFRGVPEKPEPNIQRSLHADVNDRFTSKSQLNVNHSAPQRSQMVKLADVTYYPEIEEVKIKKVLK